MTINIIHQRWNHGGPWSGYCLDVVVTSKVLRLKCLSFTCFFFFFLLLSTTLLTYKFKFTSTSLNFSIITDLRPSISLITSKPQNLKTTLRVLHFSTFLLINFHAFKLTHLKLSYFFRFVSFFHTPTIPQFQTSMRPLQNFSLRASITS